MEIPGIAPLSGQPTLTNPLNRERLLEGRQTRVQSIGEANNTVTASEQISTKMGNVEVVNLTNKTDGTDFNSSNLGNQIDLTA